MESAKTLKIESANFHIVKNMHNYICKCAHTVSEDFLDIAHPFALTNKCDVFAPFSGRGSGCQTVFVV